MSEVDYEFGLTLTLSIFHIYIMALSEFYPRSGQTVYNIKLVFAYSPLSTKHVGVRTKTGWLRVISHYPF